MTYLPSSGPELFFGVVGAVGTKLDEVVHHLTAELAKVGYHCKEIKVIELLKPFPEYSSAFVIADKGQAYDAKMTVGNTFRVDLDAGDGLALLAIFEVRRLRAEYNVTSSLPLDQPVPYRAYVFNSLKRKEEVDRLREVYGDSFHLIGAYSRVDQRLTDLRKKVGSIRDEDAEEVANKLMKRDLREKGQKWGQNVHDTYPESDVFVDATTPEHAEIPIRRFTELLFGHQFHTPTREEYGMYNAFGARLRSADLARQVGACIAKEDGQVLAMGTNDVPQPGGGQYWSGDPYDKRDFHFSEDESNVMRRKLFRNIIDVLEKEQFLTHEVAEILRDDKVLSALKEARLMWVTEYGRSVHAEMSAITDAARRGIAIDGTVLYSSTFPCHNCAKHIVAAGVHRVVYVHPYPKSQVEELYKDSIALDFADAEARKVLFKSFVGIAPRRYDTLYTMKSKRKTDDGKVVKWGEAPETVVLRLECSPLLYLSNEKIAIEDFDELRADANNKRNPQLIQITKEREIQTNE